MNEYLLDLLHFFLISACYHLSIDLSVGLSVVVVRCSSHCHCDALCVCNVICAVVQYVHCKSVLTLEMGRLVVNCGRGKWIIYLY